MDGIQDTSSSTFDLASRRCSETSTPILSNSPDIIPETQMEPLYFEQKHLSDQSRSGAEKDHEEIFKSNPKTIDFRNLARVPDASPVVGSLSDLPIDDQAYRVNQKAEAPMTIDLTTEPYENHYTSAIPNHFEKNDSRLSDLSATRQGPYEDINTAPPRVTDGMSSGYVPATTSLKNEINAEKRMENYSPFDADAWSKTITEHQSRTVQNFHVIAQTLDSINAELQYILSEFLTLQYEQIEVMLKTGRDQIDVQEKAQ
ncbi:hypothetical protein BGZ76_006259, partial [Entomortierella beljakovae]